MKEDPPLSVKCKDKVLVQSMIITPEKDQPGADLVSLSLDQYSVRFAYLESHWTTVPGENATRIHQQKLKVVSLPAEGTLQEEDEGDTAPNQSRILTEGNSVCIPFIILHRSIC
jgi:vesicle-associated membrane protein-associated protein A